MSRKILLIIAISVVILTALLYLIRRETNDSIQTANQITQQIIATPTLLPSVPQTVFQLFPNPAQPDSEGNIDIDVSINTNNNRITAAQFTLQYDPNALHFVSIKPDDAFYNAKVVDKNVNETKGTIIYQLGSPPKLQSPLQGNYHIAEIEFTAKHSGTTTVKVLSAFITSPDNKNSVVKSMTGTTVKLNY